MQAGHAEGAHPEEHQREPDEPKHGIRIEAWTGPRLFEELQPTFNPDSRW